MKFLFLVLFVIAPGITFSAESGVTAVDVKVINDRMREFQQPKILYTCEGKGESSRAPAVIESFGRKLKTLESK